MGEKNGNGEVVRIADRRADKGAEDVAAPEPEPPKQTPEEKAQQTRESRIINARESGMVVLVANLRAGRTPDARTVIGAILDLGSRAEQTERLFGQAGESFNQIAETMGALLGYLAAQDARRRMPFWRRWRMPHPEFPNLGAHVEVETEKGPPVIPQAQAQSAKAAAQTVH